MAVSHVTAGNTALASEQNALIDLANSNEARLDGLKKVYQTHLVGDPGPTITGGADLGNDAGTLTDAENLGGWSRSGGTITVPSGADGLYVVSCQTIWGVSGTTASGSIRGAYVTLNGTGGASYGIASNERTPGAEFTVMQAFGIARLVATDNVYFRAYTDAQDEIRTRDYASNHYGGTYLTLYKIAE